MLKKNIESFQKKAAEHIQTHDFVPVAYLTCYATTTAQ